jgi:hypothetical protein
VLLFEKRSKNFCLLMRAVRQRKCCDTKSFLVLFFKKELLASFHPLHRPRPGQQSPSTTPCIRQLPPPGEPAPLRAAANDRGRFAAGYNVPRKHLTGNFPQASSHMVVVNTAVSLCGPHAAAWRRLTALTPGGERGSGDSV